MTVNYTTNLALGQPVTGTESGTWGDDVNNAVTSYLDIAIAGGLAVTVTTADVTLTLTQGTSVATNIGSTTAQYAILNVSGAMTAARNLILPSSSRQYVINNACTGGFLLTVKGSATTGVTLVNGEKAHVFWTGTDYSKLSNTPGGAGTFSSITNTGLTATRVVFSTTNGLETDSANLTFDGTNLTLLGGTANGVTFLNGSKVLTSGSALTFDGTNFATTGTATAAKLIPTGNSATGNGLYLPAANSVGLSTNGTNAVYIDSTQNVGIGTSSPSTKLHVAGASAIARIDRTADASANPELQLTAVARQFNAGVGGATFATAAIQGSYYLYDATAAEYRFVIDSAGLVGIGTNDPTSKLHVVGGRTDLTAASETYALGVRYGTGTGIYYIGASNSATPDLVFSQTGGSERMRLTNAGDLGIGTSSPALKLHVVSASAAVSYFETSDTATGAYVIWRNSSTSIGDVGSGKGISGSGNATDFMIASRSTYPLLFGTGSAERARIDSSGNLLVNSTAISNSPARGVQLWSGSSNSIGGVAIGHDTGVASGNYYAIFNYASGIIGSVTQSGTTAVLYNVTSDQRLKENIQDAESASTLIDALQVRQFDWKTDNTHQRYGFIAQELVTVAPEAVHQPANPDEMMAVDYSKLVPMLVKEIQSLRKRLAALKST